MPCSAAATVLAVGALRRGTPPPWRPAGPHCRSPLPRRPTTLRRPCEASNTSRVTLVPGAHDLRHQDNNGTIRAAPVMGGSGP